jgi:hypothetical protein
VIISRPYITFIVWGPGGLITFIIFNKYNILDNMITGNTIIDITILEPDNDNKVYTGKEI